MSAYPNVKFLLSADAPQQFPPDVGAEVAMAGRSNAGKSSALNAIVGRKALARTSRTPGRTRLVNFFELEPGRRLVDLPGYGYAAVSGDERRHWGALVDAYFAGRQCLRGAIVVMDARHPLTPHDQSMLELAATRGVAVHLLLTKADKLGRGAAGKTLAEVRRALGGAATVQLFSSHTGDGLAEARGALHGLLTGRKKETPVGPAGPTGEDQPGIGG
jgi:GTP-binding protein